LLRLALLRARPLDARATLENLSRSSSAQRDPRAARGAFHGRGDRDRGALPGHQEQQVLRADIRWAWTLRLATELGTWNDADATTWRANLEPLAKTISARLKDFLPKLTNPIRTGVHPNTAFALGEALDYARVAGDTDFAALVTRRAREYYENDRACPLAYEPSGEDFFSPCLEEADLMRRVMPPADFAKWLHLFLPGLSAGKAFPLSPAVVTDPTDPRLVHLDGLNLTRSWTLRAAARVLPAADGRRGILDRAAAAHAEAGLARVSSGNYEGEHWLASFAVYLLTEAGVPSASR